MVIAFRTPEARPAAETPRLIVPVAGVRRQELRDSYGAARSGGRGHLGVDIMARDGTPVLAAATGTIVKRDSSGLGGISLYQRDLDGTTIYFYAHLSRYAAGIKEGDLVRQGDLIAYVGHTGNAQASAPHLHFGVYTVADPNRWWHGRDLNPYLLLTTPQTRAVGR
jgi:murein DD-endopeptidase MepM/ murein hydrolase activator NlpD